MGRPKQYDADLEARLISAAADAVVRDGVEALSLRTVARCAGTSTNAIYTMFGGRDGLVHAVRQAAMTGFAASQFAALERSRQGGCDPKAHLLDLGRDYRTWAIEHPSLYQVMFGAQAYVARTSTRGCVPACLWWSAICMSRAGCGESLSWPPRPSGPRSTAWSAWKFCCGDDTTLPTSP
ncbi:MAG: TetR/AcrR family transcriptional regulator [Austwickia sp.]|nr:TetR/AcrR family transcriptional regulator [Austwickia sp.]